MSYLSKLFQSTCTISSQGGVLHYSTIQGHARVLGGFWVYSLKKSSGIRVKFLLEILGMLRFEKICYFPIVFSVNTGQKLHRYSRIASQIPARILGLGRNRTSWNAHPYMTQ